MIQKNIANVVTSLRIILLPVLLYLLIAGDRMNFLYVGVMIMVTDMVDGTIARTLKQESEFGKKLDSFADFGFYPVFAVGTIVLLRVYTYMPLWVIILPLGLAIFSTILLPFFLIKRIAFLHLRSWQATTYGFLLFSIISFTRGVSVGLYYVFLAMCLTACLEEICIYLRDREKINGHIHSFFDKPDSQGH